MATCRGVASDPIIVTVPLAAVAKAQAHPSVFLTAADVQAVRAGAKKYPLLERSLDEAKAVVAKALAGPIDVPQPGEAGGYAHERPKPNNR